MLESHSTPPIDSRPIPSAPGYRADGDGTVLSCRMPSGKSGPWHVLRPYKLKKTGYLAVDLMIDHIRRGRLVHRLVLEAFKGPCPPGMEARHLDGSRDNNRADNLEWATHAVNIADKVRHGTSQVGEKHGQSKLKDEDIIEMFRLSRSGLTLKEITAIFRVSIASVSNILRRKVWSHVRIELPE
jgi:hypothetical protein